MNRDQSARILALLTAAFPRAEMPDPTVEVWMRAMLPLDFDRAYRAAEAIVTDSIFMPTVADLRRRYDDLLRRENRERLEHRALPEEATKQPLTRGQQIANVQRVREELAKVGRKVPDDGPCEGDGET